MEYARKASQWEMSQTHQNPSKARQARWARSALQEQSSNFLSAFVPKDPAVREKRVRVHFTGEGLRGGRGRAVALWSSVCVLAKHLNRQEHGPLLHPAL